MRKEKKYHFIYKTTCNITNKYYIGMHSTDKLDDGYLGSGRRLRYSINKYGKENHTREILEFCKTRKELKSRESEIVTLNEITKKECMNLVVGGSGAGLPIGYIHSTESNEKNRQSHLGITHSPETRKKMSDAQKLSWDEKRKLSWGSYMKKYWTDDRKTEHSLKLQGHIGHLKCKGVKKPEGFGEKISNALKGVPKSKSHIESMSKSHTGKKYPYSRKMTEGMEGDILMELSSGVRIKEIVEKYNISMWMAYNIKNRNKNDIK